MRDANTAIYRNNGTRTAALIHLDLLTRGDESALAAMDRYVADIVLDEDDHHAGRAWRAGFAESWQRLRNTDGHMAGGAA